MKLSRKLVYLLICSPILFLAQNDLKSDTKVKYELGVGFLYAINANDYSSISFQPKIDFEVITLRFGYSKSIINSKENDYSGRFINMGIEKRFYLQEGKKISLHIGVDYILSTHETVEELGFNSYKIDKYGVGGVCGLNYKLNNSIFLQTEIGSGIGVFKEVKQINVDSDPTSRNGFSPIFHKIQPNLTLGITI